MVQTLHDMKMLLSCLIGSRISLELQLPQQPVPVMLPSGAFEQILLNLVINARDAIAGSGIIRLAVAIRGDLALLSCTDDGPGMSDEVRTSAFDVHFTTKEEEGGTGFGLATVKRLSERAGGFVHVDSVPGHGATFEIGLPLAETEKPATQQI